VRFEALRAVSTGLPDPEDEGAIALGRRELLIGRQEVTSQKT
jgi:hypothetical protein